MIVYASQDSYNTQIFDLNEKDGMARGMAFLQSLLEDAKKNNKSYNDIHTYVEENSLIISWTQIFYSYREDCGSFKFVNVDEYIMKEVRFPDKHYEYVSSPEEEEELWNQWHKDNPGWIQNEYGIWTNEEENRKWREELEKQAKQNNKEDVKDGM